MQQFVDELKKNKVDLSQAEITLGTSKDVIKVRVKNLQDEKYKGKWYQFFRGEDVEEHVDGAPEIATGRTYKQGQFMRLYPDGPKWQWY